MTGGNTGIGRAAVRALALHGACVVVAGRREAEGKETVELIESDGGQATFVATDVTDELRSHAWWPSHWRSTAVSTSP